MKYTLLLLLLSSCALFRPSPKVSETSHEVPEWIYSPYSACTETTELCATGEGKSFSEADAQAKKNLASIFEVKVKADFTSSTSSTQGMPWQAQVRQEVQSSLQESVDQVLETVQIRKHFKKDKLVYALATLDRAQASGLIGNRLHKIDTELSLLWEKRQRTNLRRMIRLALEREKLNERYSIVNGSGLPARVSYADIMAWRESRPKTSPLILRIGQAPEWMTEKVKELLTESGFRLVKADAAKVLTMNVDSIKEFLNVEGFEKYTFTLKLTSIENGEKKKVLSTSETVTGRTQADALLKVKSYFIDYLEQNLAELHLD